jgi:hypothetical protein
MSEDFSEVVRKLQQAETLLEEVRSTMIKAKQGRRQHRNEEYTERSPWAYVTPDQTLHLAEAQHKVALIVNEMRAFEYACDG